MNITTLIVMQQVEIVFTFIKNELHLDLQRGQLSFYENNFNFPCRVM